MPAQPTLPEKNESSRDKLLQRQAELTAQLKEAQIALYSEDMPEVLEMRNQLETQQAHFQAQLKYSEQQCTKLNAELALYDLGGEQILLDAVQQQRWFWIQNKRELLFDSHSGYIFPNFQFASHLSTNQWEQERERYAPSKFHIGKWKLTKNLETNDQNFYFIKKIIASYPKSRRGQTPVSLFYFGDGRYYFESYLYHYIYEFGACSGCSNTISRSDSYSESFCVLHYLNIFPNSEQIAPEYLSLTNNEKAQLILDFFIAQDFVPFFENNKNEDDEDDDNFNESLAAEANQIFPHYRARVLALHELAEVESQLAALPAAPTQPETQ